MASKTPPSNFARLKVVPRATQVREQLEDAIRRGEYQPGDRLPSERELVEMLGVSRVSVREALRMLEAVGLVSVRHGEGCFVTDPSGKASRDLRRRVERNRDESLELLLVRGALDEVAAARAAELRDPAALAEIQRLHEEFATAVNSDVPIEDVTQADIAFHGAISRASESPLLSDLLLDLHSLLADSREVGLREERAARQSVEEHAAIVRAIVAGDAAAAREAVTAHIARVRTATEAELPAHRD
ncbi:MAG: GntR domain protein [Solirubrobacterales bacterium]|nr:GntR domain protein [Solirubrobacterales bacterium]